MANISLVSPVGRTSFMKIYQPDFTFDKKSKEFSVTMLFPKDMSMAWIQDAWDKVAIEEFGSADKVNRPLFSAGNPFDDKGAIVDGDWKYNNADEPKKPLYEAYRGHWAMRFKSAEGKPPVIIDENKIEIINPADFQAGDYARIAMDLSSYRSKVYRNNNISVNFLVIQKDRVGERFSGGMSKEAALSMFDEGEGSLI